MEKTAKETVLQRWPDAHCVSASVGCYISTNRSSRSHHISPWEVDEDAAWQAAALHESVARPDDMQMSESYLRDLERQHAATQGREPRKAQPEPRTVEEALALVTGGPDDYCDPKDQPESERGTAQRYTKKPVPIWAMVYDGSNQDEIKRFTGGNCYTDKTYTTPRFMIKTLEGEHVASVGDYIIKGVKGEFYPCKPDIFALTYEAPSPLPVRERSAGSNNGGWISVKDKLPEFREYVLGIGGSILRIPHPMKRLPTADGGFEWWYGLARFKPTHWMPLPEPPAIAGEKE